MSENSFGTPRLRHCPNNEFGFEFNLFPHSSQALCYGGLLTRGFHERLHCLDSPSATGRKKGPIVRVAGRFACMNCLDFLNDGHVTIQNIISQSSRIIFYPESHNPIILSITGGGVGQVQSVSTFPLPFIL